MDGRPVERCGATALDRGAQGMKCVTEPESHTLAYLRRIDEKLDRVQERLDRVEERLDRVEGRLDRIEDELLVLKGIALRLEGREMETTGLKAMLDRHERWLGKLGRRVAELEGAPKD
jgi:archaellum component FlaC